MAPLMKKINDGMERNITLGESDIYRKFSEQFDNLFNAEEVAKTNDEFDKMYVRDSDFEDQIKRFRESQTDMIKFCVGYTGMGKSTSVRYCFGLGISNEAKFDPDTNGEILFPTFLDGYQVRDMEKFNLSARIAAVCTGLEETHPELENLLKTEAGKEEFYEFIRRHTAFALENINPVDAMDMDKKQLIRAKLNSAYEKSPMEFQANRLKFYIKKKYDKYKRLIIILDDIESLPENYQKDTIAAFLKFHSCMKNTDYPDDLNYHVNLLISVRPHTYRMNYQNRKTEAFSISEPPVLKTKAVDLEEMFERRFQYYTKNSAKTIGNYETWKNCYDELMSMNWAFEGKYKEMISNLCFMNVREALASYSRVFANRFWVQKNKAKQDIFTIVTPGYSFNNINVIRALACNEESVFWGDSNSIIPNIFYTTREEDLSIYCLLVIRYFKIKTGDEVYGLNAEYLQEVKDEWKEIFGSDVSKKFVRSLEFLFERRILRKSIEDFDDIKTLDRKESLKPESRLYISPRGLEIYRMFSRDSVLLEMLRENAWRDYENWEYSDKSSSELMRDGDQPKIFKDLLEYIKYLSETEADVLSSVKLLGETEKYRTAFGDTPVVHTLLKGVENSLNYSGIMHTPDVENQFNSTKRKIEKLMKKL